jgi:hypothetical protein
MVVPVPLFYHIFANMKDRFSLLLCVVIVLQTLAACSAQDVKSFLSSADSVMMEKPDNALAMIECIDTSKIYGLRLKARYSLLHTMAIDRIGKDTSDYALIKDAAGYYRYHGNALDKARTLFYEGRIYFNCKDYTSANTCFLNALTISEGIDDEWLKGMICYYLSECYNRNRIKVDELKYSQLSMAHFCLHGVPRYIDNARYKLATANHNNGYYDTADSLYAMIPAGSASYKYALLGRGENEVSKINPNPKAAVSYFEEAYKEGAPFELCYLYEYAYALLLDGQTEAADRLILRLKDTTPDVKSIWWKYAIERKTGDDKNALLYYEDYAQQQSSYISSLLSQSLYKAESINYSAQKKQAEDKTIILSLTLVAVASTLFLTIFLIIGITANKRKKMELERNRLVQQINEIQGLLDTLKAADDKEKEHAQEMSSLQACYVSLYREQFSEIGKLIGINMEISTQADEIQRKHMLFINDVLDELSSDERKNKKFEERVNRSLDNIVLKIRADFPELSEESIRLLCLIIAGFKDPAIATIMNKSISAVSTRKSRLRKQILEADTPNHELYEAFLK